jgi:hypothetical protein
MATVGANVVWWSTDGNAFVLIRSGDDQAVGNFNPANGQTTNVTQWVPEATLWSGVLTHGQRHINGGCTETTAETTAQSKLADYVSGSRAKSSVQTAKETRLGI